MSKQLYTSYYAKAGRHPLAYATSSRLPPYIPNLKSFSALAPKWEFVLDQIKGTTTWDDYVNRYMDLITKERKLNAYQIVDVLPEGAILMCYEKSEEMGECHRRLFAQWIHDETGIFVPELDWEEPKPSPTELLLEW